MDFHQIEHTFSCPYCFSTISVLLDPSVPQQDYIEDCEVCCSPIQFNVVFKQAELVQFSAKNS